MTPHRPGSVGNLFEMNQEQDTDIVTRVYGRLEMRTLRHNIKLEQSGSGFVFKDVMLHI